jgi:hypothetical protein
MQSFEQENADPQRYGMPTDVRFPSSKSNSLGVGSSSASSSSYDDQLQLSHLSNQILLLKNEVNEKDLQLLEVKSATMSESGKWQNVIRQKNEEMREQAREIAK